MGSSSTTSSKASAHPHASIERLLTPSISAFLSMMPRSSLYSGRVFCMFFGPKDRTETPCCLLCVYVLYSIIDHVPNAYSVLYSRRTL